MDTIRRIVVGTDFNALATAALRFAAVLAEKSGAELMVVYADLFEPPAEFTSSQIEEIAEAAARSKARTLGHLRNYVGEHVSHTVRTTAVVVERAPADAILEAAVDAGLIVLGTHGRGGLQRLIMGSVAETIIHESPIPVLTVTTTSPPPSVRRILCAVDESAAGAEAARQAAVMAAALSAGLTLLHVDTGNTELDPSTLVIGMGVTPDVVRCEPGGHPAEAILDFANTRQYDMIVIGAERRFFNDRTTFGTTTTRVTRNAVIPVLTVPTVRPRRE